MTDTPCPDCQTPVPSDAAFCSGCGRPSDEWPAAAAAAPAHPDDDPEFRARLQRALGADFTLEEMIGQGGFGCVYRAHDTRLGRHVAIKAIRPDLAGARAFLDRFRREGVALAKLRHPGIVPIYDIREADGLIYYIMPFIVGENLRTKLERGRVAPKEAHRIIGELCDSLAASHRAGIVHRDIKPDNVILEGVLGKVLLMDFGIAKAIDDSEVTGSGLLVGTPTYMSPEQASGDTTLDQRSDLYSVGVLGYHLLTGRPPFTGQTPHEVIVKHVTEEPVPVRRLNPSVPRPLADAVQQCLAKHPDDRFGSAMDLWAALQEVTFFPATDVAAEGAAGSPFSVYTYVFVWLAAISLGFATCGGNPLEGLSWRNYLYLAALLLTLAALVSPALREGNLGRPIGEYVRELIDDWRGRKADKAVLAEPADGTDE
jgi:serine/threonine protein kinase